MNSRIITDIKKKQVPARTGNSGMLTLYNTLTRKKEVFTPMVEGQLSMYVCGPTVYDVPHIGHARSAYVFDIARKYFRYKGFDVFFVRNVTDVDDKIIAKAVEDLKNEGAEITGETVTAMVKRVAEKYLDIYRAQLGILGIEPPTREPKATRSINEMIDFTSRLVKKGYAYVSGGSVYFSVNKFNAYGKLSNRDKDELLHGVRIDADEKKEHPLDFVLWKASKPDEPSWESPWGPGRPGWHIECSVMSTALLGEQFDIHGGGIDLIFPHHENEIAQSEAATGKPFARYWMHNGLLTVRGEKMSKSLGNYITISDFLEKYSDPDILKLSFASSHYRSPVDYSDEKMEEARRGKERILIFLDKASKPIASAGAEGAGQGGISDKLREEFEQAMDDDLNTSLALSVIFKAVKAGNDILAGSDRGSIGRAGELKGLKDLIVDGSGILGLSLDRVKVASEDEEKIKTLIAEREAARKDRDYDKADAIRQRLSGMGVVVEDTAGGTEWRKT